MISNCLAVLIHGKWSHPNTPLFRILEKDLREKNYIVVKPNMPWSRTRQYDQTYETALDELAESIQQYKNKGIEKVVLIGHSIGANASMAYQARVGDADAIVALTPGHVPQFMQERDSRHAYILKKAENKIKNNNGDSFIEFFDLNCNIKKKIVSSANIFWSYFNPAGLGHMPMTIKKFKKNIPLLYIEGATDHTQNGPAHIFAKAPYHHLNTYILASGNHMTVPEISRKQITDWLNFLSS